MNGVGMGLILFGSHILEGKGEPELSHRQTEGKASCTPTGFKMIASFLCDV